jgi:hypothetical protein
MAFEIIAGYGSVCPLCCHGIAKSRSVIKPLACPTPLNPAYVTYYAQRGAWLLHGHQEARRLHRRDWGHARCVDKLDREYPAPGEQHDLAERWAEQLSAMKREAIRLAQRHPGRCRSKAAA